MFNKITESIIYRTKRLYRKCEILNTLENDNLTEEFQKRIREIRERNSQAIFNNYYLPLARKEILKKDNYLTTDKQAFHLAAALFNRDIADGKLNEFYQFI